MHGSVTNTFSYCIHITEACNTINFLVEVGYTCTIVVLSPDRTCLEMVADWPNMDVAVIMTLYGRRLFGGRPVKTAV